MGHRTAFRAACLFIMCNDIHAQPTIQNGNIFTPPSTVYSSYTCIDRTFQGNCILGPGFGYVTNETGLMSVNGKACLYADEYYFLSGVGYPLIKRKSESCSWLPADDEPPSEELFMQRLPSNVKCFVDGMPGDVPVLEMCSIPSCISLPYCYPKEVLTLGRPTEEEARTNFYKSSSAGEADPILNWVVDFGFPLPRKVQVSTAEMLFWALRQHEINEVEVTDSIRIEKAHADGLPAFVKRPVRIFPSHSDVSIVVSGAFQELSPWRSDHSHKMIIVAYGGVLTIEGICTDGNLLAISSNWPQFSFLYTILDGGAVHFVNSAVRVWCPEEVTDSLEFTLFMRQLYDTEYSLNAFTVMEGLTNTSEFVLQVPQKVPNTALAITPTRDSSTLFDDVTFQAGTLIRGLVRLQQTTLRCHREGPLQCKELDDAPAPPQFPPPSAVGVPEEADAKSGSSGLNMIVWVIVALTAVLLIVLTGCFCYRVTFKATFVLLNATYAPVQRPILLNRIPNPLLEEANKKDATKSEVALDSIRSLAGISVHRNEHSSSPVNSLNLSHGSSNENSGMVVMLNELSKFREAKQSLSSSVTDIASQHLQRSILKMRMSMLVKIQSETQRCLETYTRLYEKHPMPYAPSTAPIPEFGPSPPSMSSMSERRRGKSSLAPKAAAVDCTASSTRTSNASNGKQHDMMATDESGLSQQSSGMNETSGTEDDIPTMLEPGQLVKSENNMYRIMKSIGMGQHSICYVVQDIQTQLEYCLKYPLRGSQKRWDDAVREAQLMSQVNHPHLVSMRESFVFNSRVVIIMELCELMDLQKLVQSAVIVQRRTLEEAFVMRVIMQLCMAVHYMHVEHSFVHRDIKLANVYLTNRMDLKLGDLGGSKQLMGMTSTFAGTPMSMAPEVLTQKPYDLSSDIWSLGVLIYELCTLQPLFQASSVNSLVLRQLGSDKLATMRAMGFSGVLIDFLSGMTEVDASHRPTAAELFEHPILKEELSKAIAEKRESLNKINDFIELYHERERNIQARKPVCSEEELWAQVNGILETEMNNS